MTSFPILLRLKGRTCVVVGAGRIAAAKTAGLLRHGAQVVVVAPKAVSWIRDKSLSGELVWRPRTFRARDVRSAFLVVAATNSVAVNHHVYLACRAHRVLCNVVDDPEHCDFFYPAVVQRGALQIAISTDGQSPALAARLRKEMERQFGPEWAPFLEHIGRLRQQLQSAKLPLKRKREQLAQLAAASAFLDFQRRRRADRRGKRRS
jgi:precorrin-2 dehydrogenase/sirohydrochlorin ferrochelatase